MPDVMRPRRSFVRLACLAFTAALAFSSGVAPQAQSPQSPEDPSGQTPVFRSGVEYVSVDVFPRRNGRVVEGLTAGDFQILEDGTPQRIESFEFVRIDPNPIDSERRDPTSLADGDRQAADPRNRVFVVYLDLAHTTVEGGHHARQPVVDFLRRTIGARDLFGVMTSEVPASQLVFGRRLESIEGELARHWTWGQSERAIIPHSKYEERLSNCSTRFVGDANAFERLLFSLHRQDQLMASLENLMSRLGGLRDERKNVLFISEGWVPRGPREELRQLDLTYGAAPLPLVGVGPGGKLGLGQTMSGDPDDMSWCNAEVQRLAAIDFEARFRLLLTAAQQANVSFYPVDVAGLRTGVTARSVSNPRGPVDTLRTLAENTDGFAVVGTNDLTGGVRRIETDLSAFYLLGYSSTNGVANGRFRRIEVKVNAPDVKVSARRGYFAMTSEMAAAAAAAASRVATGPTPVDEALARLSSTRADADLFVHAAVSGSGVDVLIEVPAETIRREGWSNGTTLQVTVRNAAGEATQASATLAAGERAGRVSVPVQATDGTWRVSVEGAGRDGRIEQVTQVAGVTPVLIGQPLAFRGAPSPRAPLRPAADGRFTRLERIRVEWPMVAAADDLVARLLDRTGAPLGQPLPLTPLPDDRVVVAVDLPLNALPEGEYLVELVATKGETSERRLLAFRVVR